MNYSKIITYDTANSHGYSVSLWVCGCDKRCKGCFNPELWDYSAGTTFSQTTIEKIIEALTAPFIQNFVIMGGEPMAEKNRKLVIELCKTIKERLPNINIIIYSGYTLTELNLTLEEVKYIDYIIDGGFEIDKKVSTPQLRGSINQRCWRRGDLGWYDFSEQYFEE